MAIVMQIAAECRVYVPPQAQNLKSNLSYVWNNGECSYNFRWRTWETCRSCLL